MTIYAKYKEANQSANLKLSTFRAVRQTTIYTYIYMPKTLLWFNTIYKHVVRLLRVLAFLGHSEGSIQQRKTHLITPTSKLLISEQNSPENNSISELLHNIQLKYACAVKTYWFSLLPTPTHPQYTLTF